MGSCISSTTSANDTSWHSGSRRSAGHQHQGANSGSVSQLSSAARQGHHQEQAAREAFTEEETEAAAHAQPPSDSDSRNRNRNRSLLSRIRTTRASSRHSQQGTRTRTRLRTSQRQGTTNNGSNHHINQNNTGANNSSSNNNSSNSPNNLTASLGFSPLGVSATRRQTSETPRLIFRNPAHNQNGNNTNNNNSSVTSSHPHQTRTSTGAGTGTRTSWEADDRQGGHHYFFTYSASSSSSGGGEQEARRRRLGQNTHNQGTNNTRSSQQAQGNPYQRRTASPHAGTGAGVGGGSTAEDTSAPTDLQPDLDELYRELRVMEHLFANLFPGAGGFFQQAAQDAAFQASWDANTNDPNQSNTGPPPASGKAIRQLPTIQVAEVDLLDESNRECCICFETHNLGDKLTRLPCGHLFHGPCVHEWLHKHCTCPVCRYELETDNAQYEVGRLERMRHRKPRYHKYELERLSVRELRDLMSKCRIGLTKGTATEKRDLVDLLVKSGRITVISTASVPEIFAASEKSSSSAAGASHLVHYKLSALRKMSIGGLKKLMSDHGVFYDPADVVEKEDMVQIFVNSGRLSLLPEDEINGVVANGYNDSIGSRASGNEQATLGEAVIEGNDDEIMGDTSNGASGAGNGPFESSLESSMVELSRSDADISHVSNTGTNQQVRARGNTEDWEMIDDGNENDNANANGSNEMGPRSAPSSGLEDNEVTMGYQEEDPLDVTATAESYTTPSTAAGTASGASPLQEANANASNTTAAVQTTPAWTGGPSAAAAAARPNTATPSVAGATASASSTNLMGLSISQLKQVAYELNVNIGDCLEKREMIERIADAAHARRSNSSTNAQ